MIIVKIFGILWLIASIVSFVRFIKDAKKEKVKYNPYELLVAFVLMPLMFAVAYISFKLEMRKTHN